MKNFLLSTYPKIIVIFTFFYLGLMLGKEYRPYLVLVGLMWLIVVLIFYFFSYYIRIYHKRETLSLRNKLNVVEKTIDIRLEHWMNFLKGLQNNKISCIIKANDSKEKFFPTKKSIEQIIKIIGEQFSNDLEYFHRGRSSHVRVAYLQYDPKEETLYLRHKENEYLSKNHPYRYEANNTPYRFKNGDGSTASKAWETKEVVFIPDVDEEMNLENPRFIKISIHDNIKSILCYPIFTENIFFGVLCFSSDSKEKEGSNESLNEIILKDLNAIILHLKLIEYVNFSFNWIRQEKA